MADFQMQRLESAARRLAPKHLDRVLKAKFADQLPVSSLEYSLMNNAT